MITFQKKVKKIAHNSEANIVTLVMGKNRRNKYHPRPSHSFTLLQIMIYFEKRIYLTIQIVKSFADAIPHQKKETLSREIKL